MDQEQYSYKRSDVVIANPDRSPPFTAEPAGIQVHSVERRASSVHKRRRLTLVWGIAGSLLSAAGFVVLSLFEQYNDSLNELRRDLKHFNESSADLVKKDSLQKLRDKVKECMLELRDSSVQRLQLERELHESEAERKELNRELQMLRERLASVEGRQSALPFVTAKPAPDKPKGSTSRIDD
jgi:septal ring factor EnvC (AmiA/AmiB activator)